MVQKARDGKLTMNVIADDGPAVTATGALIGGLAGLAIGPLAAAILAAGGSVFGASAGLTNRGAGMAFAKQVAHDLTPDLTVVVAEVTTEDVAVLVARLESVDGTVTRGARYSFAPVSTLAGISADGLTEALSAASRSSMSES